MKLIAASVLLLAAAVAAQVFSNKCDANHACQETQECCKTDSGAWACCKAGEQLPVLETQEPALPPVFEGTTILGAPAQNKTIHCTSYDLGPHCLEIDIPDGENSDFWKAEGWRYNPPLWKDGDCDRTNYTVLNRVWHDLDGYKGVTKYEFGTQ